jgi:thiol:disulfide interchange protein DsbA
MRILAAFAGVLFSLTTFAATTAPSPAPTPAADTGNYLEGKDYTLIEDVVRPLDPSKIEVVEVFAFTCPHCFHFEPKIEQWFKAQKPDVNLVQLHTSWSEQMEPYQRGYYTGVILGIKDKIQNPVFDYYQVQHKELKNAEDWATFLSAYGVDKKTVLSTYDSFGVTSQIKQADSRTRGYKVTGTPTLVVEGKYRVSSGSGPDAHEKMLKVAQFLVDKARAERVAAKH